MKRTTIKVGTRFHWTHADANPKWEVTEDKGNGTWIASICDSDKSGYSATLAFRSEDIQAALSMEAFWRDSARDNDKFYEMLRPGQIVHYHNGFKAYVRCKVSDNKLLIPIALVGEWGSHDLPQRRADGSVYLGYHADNIVNSKLFKPHASNIYEYSRKLNSVDPSSLKPISLDLPALTPEMVRSHNLWKKISDVRELVNSPGNLAPEAILNRINDLIK